MGAAVPTDDRAGIVAVDRLIDVIEFLVDHPQGIGLSDISRGLGLPKSAAHRLLTSLVRRNYVEQPPGRDDYRLGLKLSSLGLRYVAQMGVRDICQPILDRLAADTGELVRLALADERGLAWVAMSQGSQLGLRYDPDMGAPVVLHATASGRAWLLELPRDEAIARVEATGFAVPFRFGKQVILSVADLVAELDRSRERGYALATGEVEPGALAVAVAVARGDGKRPLGAISVAGPIVRMSPTALTVIVPRMAAAATEIGSLWPIIERRNR